MQQVSSHERPSGLVPVSGTSSVFSDLTPTFQRLRDSVRAALDTKHKASMGARACAREFGFDKSIGWKIYQIGYAEDFVTALSAMPGARGWEIVLAKFAASNIGDVRLQAIQVALRDFEKQLAERRIDRSMLSGMAAAVVDTEDSRRQMLRLRKQASDAMAVILGVHANARIGAYLVAPSASNPGLVDLGAITVVEGLERRREGAPWSLYNPIWNYDQSGGPLKRETSAVVDSVRPPLVEELSSPGVSADEVVSRDGRPGVFDFLARRPTRQDSLMVTFAEYERSVGPAYQSGAEKLVELSMPVTIPTATAVLDVLVHRAVPRSGEIRAELYASGVVATKGLDVRSRLQLTLESRVEQPASLHVEEAGAAASAAYQEICRRTATKLGFALSDFEYHRIVVPHPPVPCTIMLWWELAQRSG